MPRPCLAETRCEGVGFVPCLAETRCEGVGFVPCLAETRCEGVGFVREWWKVRGGGGVITL